MSIKRWNARRDANEPAIVEALEKVGATVERWEVCDLVVGYQGRTYLIEVKTEKGKLTKKQKTMREKWRGHLATVRDAIEALQAIGANSA